MRFRKLLFACNGMIWAAINPASEVSAIKEKAKETLREKLQFSVESTDTYVKSVAELVQKHEELLSEKDAPSIDDFQATTKYICMRYAGLEEIFTEESQAAILYAEFMLPRQIKN